MASPMDLKPDELLLKHADLLTPGTLKGPVLDLACGDGHNGLYLAARGLSVVLADTSLEALEGAGQLARRASLDVTLWHVDLEKEGTDPLKGKSFGAVLVFRYLHRPLIPSIMRSIMERGILVYETYTTGQPRFGRPNNPHFLLKPGELAGWFRDWEIIHYFEGVRENPMRAVARIVCRKSPQGEPDGTAAKG